MVDNRFVVHVVNDPRIDVIDRAIVVKRAAVPIAAGIADTGVAKTVVDPSIKSYTQSPKSFLPQINTIAPTPVAGCP
jgi:hypothetical protein